LRRRGRRGAFIDRVELQQCGVDLLRDEEAVFDWRDARSADQGR
jgi:hypothetical protein